MAKRDPDKTIWFRQPSGEWCHDLDRNEIVYAASFSYGNRETCVIKNFLILEDGTIEPGREDVINLGGGAP